MPEPPIFIALATSTRQLQLLLKCLAFSNKAGVSITSEGIKFSTEESHAIQASTLLGKSLFSSYNFRLPDDVPFVPSFQININALLETLQIFDLSEVGSTGKKQSGGTNAYYATAFTTPALGLGGMCRISYAEIGGPLSIIIEDSGVKTVCEMNTYELPEAYDDESEIPLDRSAVVLKIIMPSSCLHDAMTELSGTDPDVLMVKATQTNGPCLTLEGQGGPFGDSTVDFLPEQRLDTSSGTAPRTRQPQATETFSIAPLQGSQGIVKQRYKFGLIKRAGRAMALGSKVSIRQDRQGVMSLQFMVEPIASGTANAVDPGRLSYIDFRFVPLVDSDAEDGEAGSEEDEELL